jgi:hypothetical protein
MAKPVAGRSDAGSNAKIDLKSAEFEFFIGRAVLVWMKGEGILEERKDSMTDWPTEQAAAVEKLTPSQEYI